MKVDGVFAGGGIKAYAFVGAYEVLEHKGIEFVRLAGTSVGALFSAFIAAGYTSAQLHEMLEELDEKIFLDERFSLGYIPFFKWLRIYHKLGLYKGEKLERWIEEKLAQKGVRTFGDLPKGSLKIVASDLTKGKLVVLPDDLPDYGYCPEKFPVAKALRMSVSIPYFYEPVKLFDKNSKFKYSIIVDGGVLSNFPIWLFLEEKKKKRPVIGFRLTPNLDSIPMNKNRNAIEMFHSLFDTMKKAHDVRYISKRHAKNIVFLPADNIKATDFDLSKQEKEALMQLGKERTESFLKTWQF